MNKKIKVLLIIEIIIAVALTTAILIVFFNNKKDNSIDTYNKKDNSNDTSETDDYYINIWRNNAFEPDIMLHSVGSGDDKKFYLGSQPVHYLINNSGEIYSYQQSSYENAKTGKRDPAQKEFLKKISSSDLKNIETKLEKIIKNYKSKSDYSCSYFVKYNGETIPVNANVYQYVLEEYLDEKHDEKVEKRRVTKLIHDFMVENFVEGDIFLHSGDYNMFSLTDEEKNTILNEFKKQNSDVKLSDKELLQIIDDQGFTIWYEDVNSMIDEETDL